MLWNSLNCTQAHTNSTGVLSELKRCKHLKSNLIYFTIAYHFVVFNYECFRSEFEVVASLSLLTESTLMGRESELWCLVKTQVALQLKPKIRQPKDFRKVETTTGRAEKCAIAILLLQIIDMQQQHMFAFFILYQRWVNEYMHILNVAFLRRWRHLRRIRVAPYTWTIPRPAESWFFAIHWRFCTVRWHNSSSFYLACALVSNSRFNSRAISSHIFRTSLLISSSWRSAHRLTTAVCSSCGHLSHCFLYFTAEPSANLELFGLSHHSCRTIGPTNVGWKWGKF